MRSTIIVVAGLALGALPMTALDGTLPQSAVLYQGDALRAAIADGMSRAGGTLASAGSEEAADSRH